MSRAGVTAVLIPAAVLASFAWLLPIGVRGSVTAVSDETCLSLADTPPRQDTPTVELLERCSALHPDDPELQADLGKRYEQTGDARRAEERYRAAVAADPAYADVRLRLGRLLLRRGAADEARSQAEAALRVQPNRRAALELLHNASGATARARQ